MGLENALKEWHSKHRRMGCVAATDWLVKRVPTFHPLRLIRYTKDGEIFHHVVATDDRIIIDLAPYADNPQRM